MRVLDLASASLVAVTSIAFLVAWNPATFSSQAQRDVTKASLTDALDKITSAVGLLPLLDANSSELCDLVSHLSNSTVSFSAENANSGCALPPPGAEWANLTVSLGATEVELLAWEPGGQ